MTKSIGLIILISTIGILLVLAFSRKITKKTHHGNMKKTAEIYAWMEMSPQEREAQVEAHKVASMKRRKSLLKKIREEYKTLKSLKN